MPLDTAGIDPRQFRYVIDLLDRKVITVVEAREALGINRRPSVVVPPGSTFKVEGQSLRNASVDARVLIGDADYDGESQEASPRVIRRLRVIQQNLGAVLDSPARPSSASMKSRIQWEAKREIARVHYMQITNLLNDIGA